MNVSNNIRRGEFDNESVAEMSSRHFGKKSLVSRREFGTLGILQPLPNITETQTIKGLLAGK